MSSEPREELREKALKALKKPAEYGIDIDLTEYAFGEKGKVENISLKQLPKSLAEKARAVGVDLDESKVSGTFFQLNHSVVRRAVTHVLEKYGVVVMSTEEALRKIPWAKEYYWKAIPVDADKYTAITELEMRHGYFVYVPPGVKVKEPIQACLFISEEKIAQPVHNIVIVDEGAELNLVTACATTVHSGLHVGVSEFYIKKNAKLTFTMIHSWGPKFHVRPRTVAVIEEGGVFSNYYIQLSEVDSLQSNPAAIVEKGGKCYFTSILLAKKVSKLDIGGEIHLRGEKASGEIVSRSVINDEAHVTLRGKIVGYSPLVKGHLECKALILSEKAEAEAIPILVSRTDKAELTHEAALGRVSEEELLYLTSKGFTEEEATSIIVRGFLEIGLENIPERLRKMVQATLDVIARKAVG